jgi:hypothetical protein
VSVGSTDTLFGRGLIGFFVVLRDRFTGTVPPKAPFVGLALFRFNIANAFGGWPSEAPIVEVELPVE